MKLAVKEAKLTGLWTDFDFKIGPELKFPGLSRNGPQALYLCFRSVPIQPLSRVRGPFLERPGNFNSGPILKLGYIFQYWRALLSCRCLTNSVTLYISAGSLAEDFELEDFSQVLEDPEPSVSILRCTGRLAGPATATRTKVAAIVRHPVTGGVVGIFKAHNVTILHRCTIHSVSGVNLESGVRVVKPLVPSNCAGDSI